MHNKCNKNILYLGNIFRDIQHTRHILTYRCILLRHTHTHTYTHSTLTNVPTPTLGRTCVLYSSSAHRLSYLPRLSIKNDTR